MEKIRNVNFKYTYIDMGSIAGTSKGLEIKKNRVFLDVGNGLFTGVIDHHQMVQGISAKGSVFRSATKLVTIYPEYILKNLSDDVSEVEIILHNEPDFDCFGATYLVKYLIEYDIFPEGYEEFAEYVDAVDAGTIKIQNDNYKEIFAVAYSIKQVLAENVRTGIVDNKVEGFDFKNEVMKKWFALFDLMVKWTIKHKTYTLIGADIFENGSDFIEEIAFLKSDFSLYQEDLNNKDFYEIVRIKLPQIDSTSNRLFEVEGLVYNKTPQCCLTKLWARVDSEHSSGNGFAFTFIPTKINDKIKISNDREDYKINKTIISVDPNSGYSLYGLAIELEKQEVIKEKEIFSKDQTLMRNRSARRPGFTESWCTNDDPWYDGRNFKYTIVDSPRRGSILSIEEIKSIVLNFTTAKIINNTTKIIVPFSIDEKMVERVFQNPQDFFGKTIEKCNISKDGYFLDYLERYLYSESDRIAKKGCSKYEINTSTNALLLDENERIKMVKVKDLPGSDQKKVICEFNSIVIVLYKYGVGTFCINAITDPDMIRFDQALKKFKNIRTNYKNVYDELVLENKRNYINIKKPLIYSAITVDSDGYFEEEKKEMLYKLCNGLLWEEPYINSQYIESSLEDLFMEMDEFCSFGFSKSGGVILCTSTKLTDKSTIEYINSQIKSFNTTYFEIFTFALHQRLSLMRFENLLSQYDGDNNIGDLSKLRRQMMNFITQGWFNQITEDEIGQQIYKRWQIVFENEKLYQEVIHQIETVDEYNHALKTKTYENLSIFVFPLLLIMQILSSGLIKTKTIGPDGGIDWWYTVTGILLVSALTYVLFKLRKR